MAINMHGVTTDAMRAAYPQRFEPDEGYQRVTVPVEEIEPGDFLVSKHGRRSLAGAVVQRLDWLDTNGSDDPSKWRKVYFVQLENFVPLTRVEPYKTGSGEAEPRYVEVYRPILAPETCEHGLSANLCEGPQHYPYDEDERQAYGF